MLAFADRIAVDALLFTSVSCFIALFSDMGLYKRAIFLFPMLLAGLLLFFDMLMVIYHVEYFSTRYILFKTSLVIQVFMVVLISAAIILPEKILDWLLSVFMGELMGLKKDLKA
jgi:hypothetical protein